MKRSMAMLAVFGFIVASPARAQSDKTLEFRPFAGVAIPMGAQRDVFKDALLVGMQGAVRVKPAVDLVVSFAWQNADSKYNVSQTTANVFVYDIGLEQRFAGAGSDHERLVPFVGGGVGGRAYDFRSSVLTSQTCFAGYGTAGATYDLGGMALRLGVRDNVLCYRSPIIVGESATRNEVNLTLGLGVRF